ncbi:MAG: hypothetical protein WC003_02510 [Terrimicrobiaceae bacterium]
MGGLCVTPINLIWLFWHPAADAVWHFPVHLLGWQTDITIRQVYQEIKRRRYPPTTAR